MYRLVLRSRKPEAAAFTDWVTDEVLPSIRKTGGYGQRAQIDFLAEVEASGFDVAVSLPLAVIDALDARAQQLTAEAQYLIRTYLLRHAIGPKQRETYHGHRGGPSIDAEEVIACINAVTLDMTLAPRDANRLKFLLMHANVIREESAKFAERLRESALHIYGNTEIATLLTASRHD